MTDAKLRGRHHRQGWYIRRRLRSTWSNSRLGVGSGARTRARAKEGNDLMT